jgi:uncharacterized protein (TIGR02118 family)
MFPGKWLMVKVVILIEPPEDRRAFDEGWPEFLHHAEAMPGLRREAASQVDRFLYGRCSYAQMHELFFDSLSDAEKALSSLEGKAAGRQLQQITQGRMALFLADHKEEGAANLRKYRAKR